MNGMKGKKGTKETSWKPYAAVVLGAVIGFVGACAKDSKTTAAPGAAEAMAPADVAGGDAENFAVEGAALEESLEDDLKDDLAQLEAELAELDVGMSHTDIKPKRDGVNGGNGKSKSKTSSVSPVPAGAEERSRCERICDLNQAICDVSARICALASQPDHVEDARYAESCNRAEARCEQAENACNECG